MNLVNQAWLYAKEKHDGQLDDDGLPYFSAHCTQVANLIRIIGGSDEMIAAAMLHDVLEDTDATYDQILSRCGKVVADLVLELTHEGKADNDGYYNPRLESRGAIVIKFADRLSNLSRMDSWSKSRQKHYLKKSKFWRSERNER